MSDLYWQFVEPVWDSINIYENEDVFLNGLNKATEKQATLFVTHWTQSEIMNGGLGQYFSNPTGIMAPEAAIAFERLKMPNCSKILKEAMKFFGDSYPRERSQREKKFEEFWDSEGVEAIPFEDLENAMALEIEGENGGFWGAANLYADS